jgi:amino acid adenylation domain-containing protein
MNTDVNTIDTSQTGLEIAVIGMATRFPGAANIDEFWNNLKNGVESIRFFTYQELLKGGVDQQLLEKSNYVKANGILENVEYFDAPFFEYTHREAEVMDPQVRIFHEITWEALEYAGYDPQRYPGLIGLYAGAAPNSFWEIQTLLAGMNTKGKGVMDLLSTSQLNDKDFLCTRVSYKLDLKGPSFPIYTTCSTSLVAIHLAVQGLLGGECDMAIAGGVKVSYPQSRGYLYQEGMVYSPDGHCRALDAKARGIVGGDGVGVVLLKRLEDSIRDRDNIYAIIKGSAINNDGKRKVGYAAPSIKGQLEVIKAALRMGEVNRESISFVEAHGTGTIMGDPVEVEALKMAFNTEKKRFCAIGSVKTNIGHTDAAAGVAGFIKAVLALKHQVIPPSLHFESPNPEIDFENSPFYVNTTVIPWKRSNNYPRRAGVSSFGIGGTNAHVILEEWPSSPPPTAVNRKQVERRENEDRKYQLILLSAKTPPALDRMTENLGNYFKENHGNPGNIINPGLRLADAAYTLQVGRGEFKCRRMLVCSTPEEAVEALTLKPGESHEAYHKSTKLKTFFNKEDHREVVFMFPGQGSQYVNMGWDLYRTEPVFREVMDRSFEILKSLTGYDIKPIIYPDGKEQWSSLDRVKQAEIIQPFIFSFEYALAQLLMAWDIKPHAMIGYSLGEYPAACLAEVLSFKDALDLVAFRGRLTAQQPERVMLNVPMPEEELKALLEEDGFDNVSLAVVNEPSCIVAGSNEAIKRLKNRLKEKRVMSMRVNVPQATHWVMTDSTLQEFQKKIRHLNIKAPKIPIISCITGEWINTKEVQNLAFWSRLLNDTVRFSRGIRNLIECKKEKNPVFIEVGPGRDLTVMVRRYIDEKAGQHAVNLVRPQQQKVSDNYYLLEKIGRLWLYGVPIDWHEYYKNEKRFRISLPTYSFDKYKYWLEPNLFQFIADILIKGKETRKVDMGVGTISGNSGELVDSMELAPETLYMHLEQCRRSAYAAPQNPLQHQLAHIWQDFFGLHQVGIDDDFFELGGDSLKAITMVYRIHQGTDVKVPLEEFFKRPYIRVLSEYIETADKETFQFINTAEEKKYYPLSPAQKRNFILQQMSPDSVGYNLGAVVILEGILDKEKFEKIFKKLIKRHESFRTSFIIIEKEPVQRIQDDVEFEIEYYEAGHTNQNAKHIIKNFTRPFELSQAPLLRVCLVKEKEQKHIFMVDMHHIITDGTSLAIVIREFTILYKDGRLPPLNLRYRDFCQWLVKYGMTRVENEKQYWLTQFQTDVPVTDLPCDFPRPEIQGFKGKTIPFILEKEETAVLRRYSKEADATLYMVVLALFNIFITKLSGQEDIIVGTPVAGRRHPDLMPLVGVFINTLAMRNYPHGSLLFNLFLEQVKKNALEAFDNQGYPFEELVEVVTAQGRLQRDASRNPLFDLFFSFENVNIPEIEMPGLTLKPLDSERTTALFDLVLYCSEVDNDERLLCRMEYSTELYEEETIRRFIRYFQNIVSTAAADPTVKIADIEIISEEEKKQILEEFNDAHSDYDIDKTIHRLFEMQVDKTPDSIAIVGVIHELPRQITYQELNEKSNQLAHYLVEQRVAPGEPVGMLIDRSPEMIIGILGILKAGCGYVPLNPKAPVPWTNYILKECKVKIVLTLRLLINKDNALFANHLLLCIDEYKNYSNMPLLSPGVKAIPGDWAYVIFTSGSTGKPKGVPITHTNLSPLLHWGYQHLELGPDDRTLQNLSYYFDWSVWEIFITLTTGASLYVVPDDLLLNPNECIAFIEKHKITVLHATPSHYRYFVNAKQRLETLKYLFLGAEKLTQELFQRSYESVNSQCQIFNMYGPTEATIISAVLEIQREDNNRFKHVSSVPIGGPVGNTTLLVLTSSLSLCPINVTGELYIGGDGTAAGYLNRPELTIEKFIRSAISPSSLVISFNKDSKITNNQCPLTNNRFYRTGDLTRWLPNGNIEFLGRMDFQVKIRGYRIEPEEIETHLLGHLEIKEAVVLALGKEQDDKFLCAYVVLDKDNEKKPAEMSRELSAYLSQLLPDYMVPSHFVAIEKIPLTPNGKLDHRALPAPDARGREKTDKYIPPSNQIEKKLVAIWEEVLGKDPLLASLGIDDNFFHMGGHSLKATLLVSRIHKELNAKITLAEVFRTPTIRGLAQHIEESVEEAFVSIQPVEEKEHYILSSAQRRIFILSKVEENSITYNIPSIVGLEGVIHLDRLEATLCQLNRRQEILRTSFHTILHDPRQRIHPVDEISFAIEYIENRDSPASIVKDFIRPFDLSRASLMRVGLIKTDENNHVLVVDMHHIITDGTSLGIFIRELLALYSGQQLPELRLQYKDYAEWQTGVQRSEYLEKSIKKQEQYWFKQFEGDIPQLAMSTDFPRPQVRSFEGKNILFEIDTYWTAEIKELARETATTVYMVLLAIFNILLSKYCIQEDIVVGTGVAGRRHADLQNLIGMFVNMLPMRNYPREEKCFFEFLQDVKKNAVDAFENQEYQFEELVDKLDIPRDSSRNPIFDVEFTLQNTEAMEMNINIPGIRLKPFEGIDIEKTKFDLVLQAGEGQGKIYLSLSYSTDLFKQSTAEKMPQHYQEALQQVLENRKVKLGDIKLTHKLSTAPVVINKEEALFGF